MLAYSTRTPKTKPCCCCCCCCLSIFRHSFICSSPLVVNVLPAAFVRRSRSNSTIRACKSQRRQDRTRTHSTRYLSHFSTLRPISIILPVYGLALRPSRPQNYIYRDDQAFAPWYRGPIYLLQTVLHIRTPRWFRFTRLNSAIIFVWTCLRQT